jgi:acyl-CoA hydrolase
MKNIFKFGSMLILAAAFFVVSVQAQTIKSNVPFDFSVSGKTYKAGKYAVKIDSANASTVMLQDAKGKTLATLSIVDTGEAATGDDRLVFGMVENQQQLAKIIFGDKTFSLSGAEAKNATN